MTNTNERVPHDTRYKHGFTCYCESCCETAQDWYEWRNVTDDNASGSRYWSAQDAMADAELAGLDGLTRLVHQPDGRTVKRPEVQHAS